VRTPRPPPTSGRGAGLSATSARPRFMEKGNLEVLLFTVQSRMRANNQKVYVPREGKLISDINKVGRRPWWWRWGRWWRWWWWW